MAHHGKPEIFNTDQGSQFTGSAFTGVLASNGIAMSMDGKGAWPDNVFVEQAVAQRQVRGGLSQSLRQCVRGARLHRALPSIAAGRIRALTTPHPITPTSPRCPSAWQPNLGRRSTYRCVNSVQTTGTTSKLHLRFRWM